MAIFVENHQFLPAQRSKRCPCYGNVAFWLAGWLAVCHSRCCIKRLNLS